jgi:hypothetical protein
LNDAVLRGIEVEGDSITSSSGGSVRRKGVAVHADLDIVVRRKGKSHKGGAGEDGLEKHNGGMWESLILVIWIFD